MASDESTVKYAALSLAALITAMQCCQSSRFLHWSEAEAIVALPALTFDIAGLCINSTHDCTGEVTEAVDAVEADAAPLMAPVCNDSSSTANTSDGDEIRGNKIRRAAIREEFAWSWSAYVKHAWGRDELLPLSQTGRDWVPGGLGLTIIDSLDALILMGFDEELDHSLNWVNHSLNFHVDAEISTFETTIRALGGLLSAHALTHEPVFLHRATDLGYRILAAFATPSGLPTTKVNLRRGAVQGSDEPLVLSEVGTLQLEMTQLSAATGDGRFKAAVDAVAERLATEVVGANREVSMMPPQLHPLLPILMDHDGWPLSSMTSIGAGGDSYYEYLLKGWLQTGQSEPMWRKRYAAAAGAIVKGFVHQTDSGQSYLQELNWYGEPRLKMDHLTCFVPGMLALGASTAAVSPARSVLQMSVAQELLETCCNLYASTPTGLAAEIVEFGLAAEIAELGMSDHEDEPPMRMQLDEQHRGRPARSDESRASSGREFGSQPQDQHSLLRPETVESLFILWRLTHDPKWREHGWAIFEAIRTHARLDSGGYASVESVEELPVRYRDGPMESFWLAETLKYLFLLFSDDSVLPLDQWVFNTEAHPLPILSPEHGTAMMCHGEAEGCARERS